MNSPLQDALRQANQLRISNQELINALRLILEDVQTRLNANQIVESREAIKRAEAIWINQ